MKICTACQQPFEAVGRAIYCSVECRRSVEFARRRHDRLQPKIALWGGMAKRAGRAAWGQKYREHAEKLKAKAGERP